MPNVVEHEKRFLFSRLDSSKLTVLETVKFTHSYKLALKLVGILYFDSQSNVFSLVSQLEKNRNCEFTKQSIGLISTDIRK